MAYPPRQVPLFGGGKGRTRTNARHRGSVSHRVVRHGSRTALKSFVSRSLRTKVCMCKRVRHESSAEISPNEFWQRVPRASVTDLKRYQRDLASGGGKVKSS